MQDINTAMRGQWILTAPGIGIVGRYADQKSAEACRDFREVRGLETNKPVSVKPSESLFDDKRSGQAQRRRMWEQRQRSNAA